MSPTPPPRLAERLLALSIRDDDWRASILGDLSEEFQDMRRRTGDARARRWYWRTAVSVGSRTFRSALRSAPQRAWSTQMIDDGQAQGWRAGLVRDVQHAVRGLVRQPALSLVILATLALALAANSTIFAVLDAIVLRPYRFEGMERLVVVASSDPQQGLFDRESVSPADFRDWSAPAPSLERLSAVEWWDANLSGRDEPELVNGFRVSPNFFETFNVRPVAGRGFLPQRRDAGTASSRGDRSCAVDAAICRRPGDRRPDCPLRRGTLRGGRHRPRRIYDPTRRAGLGAARLSRQDVGRPSQRIPGGLRPAR